MLLTLTRVVRMVRSMLTLTLPGIRRCHNFNPILAYSMDKTVSGMARVQVKRLQEEVEGEKELLIRIEARTRGSCRRRRRRRRCQSMRIM